MSSFKRVVKHLRFERLFWGRRWRETKIAPRKTHHTRSVSLQNFCPWNPKYERAKKKRKKMWRKISSFELHLFLWKDTHRHTLLLILKMFSVTQTVTQSVRLNATVSKRDVTRRYEEVLLLVFSVCVGSIIRECILFFFISSFRHTSFFPINANAFGRARAKENDVFIPLDYKHHSPWKLLLFPPFVEKRE